MNIILQIVFACLGGIIFAQILIASRWMQIACLILLIYLMIMSFINPMPLPAWVLRH
jgi:hypothetical protein